MDTTIFSDETVQSLIELGRQTAGPQTVQTIPESPVPFIINEGAVKLLPELVFNEYAKHPQRVKANVGVLDPESFIEYYALFSDANSRVFAYEPEIRVLAVLDYHAAGEGNSARWGQHRLTLTLQHSEEWKRWVGRNNGQMIQEQFAEFLEQNSIDIVNPSPASMMEVARDLKATTEVEFGAGVRMQDGQVRFKYSETTKASVGSGQLAVPEQFVISLPVFVGGPRVQMQALLRFRVKEGKLVIWYTLVRPEDVSRTAFLVARQQIADALKVNIINGLPA
jgi:uncharacterized protein YfdQ (DUF2303 family)